MKKRNILFTVVSLALVLAVVLSLAGCFGSKDNDKKTGLTAQDGKLIVGFDASFPPMGFRDEVSGEYVGFDLDVAQEVATRLNLTLVKQPIVWDVKDKALENGEIDVIWNGFTMNEERADKYTWTKPYMLNYQVVMVLGDSEYKVLDDVKNKKLTLGVQNGSSAQNIVVKSDTSSASFNEEFATAFNKNIVASADYLTMTMELTNKTVDCLLIDKVVADYVISKNEGKFKLLEGHLVEEKYGVGCKLGNEALRGAIEKTMLEMIKDGKMGEISKKWFGKNVVVLDQQQ